ncbi:hypothetical protein H6F86_13145 [Phormidium sp. FACHB-592]|uniref:Uncharacterized protein n=1 Tax=Stenomitos frigidus AS-A4 TaxID=2933935 RepID=A0ABV0KJM7_9CYAN|nr:hypothetical protein [Phormidium sp. FACHB-592]MBD2074821.1 hypothetical protein [Phormidium sp. FACHB-592]
MNIFRDNGAIGLLSRIFWELYPKANIINTFSHDRSSAGHARESVSFHSTIAMKKPYTVKVQGIRVEFTQPLRDDRL